MRPDGVNTLVGDGDHELRGSGGILAHGGVEVLDRTFLASLEGPEQGRRLSAHMSTSVLPVNTAGG